MKDHVCSSPDLVVNWRGSSETISLNSISTKHAQEDELSIYRENGML
jgi:hypothetical protein